MALATPITPAPQHTTFSSLDSEKEVSRDQVTMKLDIIDIRRAAVETNLKSDVLSMWNPSEGPRKLPTLLLYNEKGLQLFEDVGCDFTQPLPGLLGLTPQRSPTSMNTT